MYSEKQLADLARDEAANPHIFADDLYDCLMNETIVDALLPRARKWLDDNIGEGEHGDMQLAMLAGELATLYAEGTDAAEQRARATLRNKEANILDLQAQLTKDADTSANELAKKALQSWKLYAHFVDWPNQNGVPALLARCVNEGEDALRALGVYGPTAETK